VSLGGVTLTAHITGGHTKGCTTWTFPVTIAGKVRQALDLCSASVLPGYKLGKTETYPGQTADYRKSFAFLNAQHVDVPLGSHPAMYGMAEKYALMKPGGPNPFVNAQSFRDEVRIQETAFTNELQQQMVEGPPPARGGGPGRGPAPVPNPPPGGRN